MTTVTTAPSGLAELMQQEMEAWSVPGLALGTLRDGEIETWGFGIANIETEQPVRPDTLFQIGSITKVFTATVIMQLVDEGRLDLDAPVRGVLPSFRLEDDTATETVTLRHLLTHTTGFYGDRFDDFGPGDDALSNALAEFHSLRQYTPPGTEWSYCNTGFQALGAIVEALTESTAEQAIRERVLKPLGLERSFFFAHEAITYSAAAGHNRLPGKDLTVARPYPLIRAMNAAGGIIGTVGDLLRFAQFHLNLGALSRPQPPTAGASPPVPPGNGTVDEAPVLSEASIRAMQERQTEAGLADYWGLGWSLDVVDGLLVAGHGGSTNGFRAKLSFVPEKGIALAVLTNGNGGRPVNRSLERWFLEQYAGVQPSDPPVVAFPPEALARFAGHYRSPTSEIDVTPMDGSLQIDLMTTNPFTREQTTWPPQRLVPSGDRRFILTEGESVGEPVDFIGDGETPRFMRYHGRLIDRSE